MVEEKKDLEMKLRNRRRASRGAVFWCIAIGYAIFVMGLTWQVGVSTFEDSHHLTSPSIPLKDAKNATYNFTAKEASDMSMKVFLFFIPGAALIAAGFAIMSVNPGERELHIAHCPSIHATPGDYPKYCPECGMDMKKMEKYKQE